MKITSLKNIFKELPQLHLAFLRVQNVDPTNRLSESQHLLQEQEKFMQMMFHKDSKKYHELVSTWTMAMEDTKGKAKHYATSLEKMMKKVLAKKTLTTHNVVENLIHFMALKYLVPIGFDDYDKIRNTLTFTLSKKKELVYTDKKGVIGM